MAAHMLSILRTNILRLESRVLGMIGLNPPQFPQLDFNTVPVSAHGCRDSAAESSAPSVEQILRDGMMWLAVPKRRRSLERRRIIKMNHRRLEKNAKPRDDLVSCLQCGQWHEVWAVCGNCYAKVRAETKSMQESMNKEDRLYKAPRAEVAYVYENEDASKFGDRYVVELDRPRPSWWTPKQLGENR